MATKKIHSDFESNKDDDRKKKTTKLTLNLDETNVQCDNTLKK